MKEKKKVNSGACREKESFQGEEERVLKPRGKVDTGEIGRAQV